MIPRYIETATARNWRRWGYKSLITLARVRGQGLDGKRKMAGLKKSNQAQGS